MPKHPRLNATPIGLSPDDPTLPPRQALSTCLGCGQGVLLRVWVHGQGWREGTAPYRSPLTGRPHVCGRLYAEEEHPC